MRVLAPFSRMLGRMAINGVLAQITVSDLAQATEYYGRLFGRGPDENPMPGLLEWHFTSEAGLQLWADSNRSGKSTVVFNDDDLESVAARLDAAKIEHGGIEDATHFQILQVLDPEGNHVVFTSASS